MRTVTHTLIALSLTALFAGCGGGETTGPQQTTDDAAATAPAAPSEDIGEVIATVGDVQVGSKEFELAARRKRPADGEELSAEEKREVLDTLITEKILYQEARRKGIDRDPKVQKVMINTLLREDVYANVRNSDFSQEELQAYFEEHKDEFVVPEKVQVKRIFVKGGDRRPGHEAKATAEDLRSQVSANPDRFKEIATEHSEDPYRRRGGDLGFVSREGKPGVPPEVIERAFELEVGEVSEPFEAGGGWNVIYVAHKRDRVERTFDQMKGSVLRKVKNERYKQLYDDYVGEVRGEYQVDVDAEKLSAIEVQPARRLTLGPGSVRRPGDGDGDDEEGEE